MRTRSLLIFAVSSLIACASDPAVQDLGVGPSPPDQGGAQPDLSTSPDLAPPLLAQCGNVPVLGSQGTNTAAACLSCMATSCCAEATTCGSDNNCSALRTCLNACTSYACTATCYGKYAQGRTQSDAVETCRSAKCNPACNNLSCAGSVVWPDPPQATYSMKLYAVDYATRKNVSNVQVKVCPSGDVACANPTAMGTTDATGAVTLDVPVGKSGINGYLELSSSSSVTSLHFVSHTNNVYYWNGGVLSAYIVSKTLFAQLAGAVGATVDPARGHLGFLTEDCGGRLVAGVSVNASTADAQSIQVYSLNGVPSKSATQTDSSSFGYIINVPTGPAVLTSRSGATQLGSQNVLFRAGALTTVNTVPTP